MKEVQRRKMPWGLGHDAEIGPDRPSCILYTSLNTIGITLWIQGSKFSYVDYNCLWKFGRWLSIWSPLLSLSSMNEIEYLWNLWALACLTRISV